MSGTTQTNQAQQQQSTTNPWAPATPLLKNILTQAGTAGLGPTAGQTSATGELVNAASGVPNYGTQGEGVVNNLFRSSTAPQQDMLNSAYGQQAGMLSPYLNADYTNPYTNPALASAMSTMNSDITNQIEGQAAAAGRPIGTNASASQALARGLSQGEGGLLAGEFNTLTGNQLQAGQQLGTAAGNTASGITGQQQTELGNEQAGIGAAGSIPGLLTMPASTELAAATSAAQLPTANLANMESLVNPIAALGGQSTGTSTGTTSTTTPAITNAIAATMAAGTLANKFLPSDERVKENMRPIGMLYDKTPVYSFRFKGDSKPRIGLKAQDVERRRPDAVRNFGGIKVVDHGKASERSRRIGMLADVTA